MVRVRGHDIEIPTFGISSASRRVVQLKNEIRSLLVSLGVHEDDVEFREQRLVLREGMADVSWYQDGRNCYYSHTSQKRFIENLYVILQILRLELEEVESESNSLEDFITLFAQEGNVSDERKRARELLGVDASCTDFDEINRAYKKLARKHHPDLGGEIEKFKEIEWALRTLKHELA